MNWLIVAAGLFSAFTTLGHFSIGSRQFLAPMLGADFDRIPKKVMHCVFHYISVFLILATATLLLAGFGVDLGGESTLLVRFIGLNYAGFAVTQLGIALTSGIPKGAMKLFQWTFFTAVAVCAFAGTY